MKDEKKALMPRLRFPEFRDAGEWEEERLMQVSKPIFDGTHQTPKYTEVGVPFFSVENIVSGKTNKFISKEDHDAATSKNKPEKGDILLTRIGKIGFSAIVDWDYEFSIYVTLAVVKKSRKFVPYYMHSYFQSERYQREILNKSLLNAVPCKINMDELRKTEILLPSLPEQQKIADCLSSLDALIATQADKLDALKTHKKGLMQKLFPREGETVPRLRFPEFREAGEWGVNALSNLTPLNEKFGIVDGPFGSNLKTIHYKKEGVPIITSGYVTDGVFCAAKYDYVTPEKFEKEKRSSVKGGDIVMAKIGARCGASAIMPVDHEPGILSGNALKITIDETRFSVMFVWQQLWFLHQAGRLDGLKKVGAQPAISIANLKKFEIVLPHESKEQHKIADCLSSLDALITAQSEKIDVLKAHKKGLMQQLFPNPEAAGA